MGREAPASVACSHPGRPAARSASWRRLAAPLAAAGNPSAAAAEGDTEDTDDEDYVPASLRAFLAGEDAVLTRMVSSIDNLNSTPARIALHCREELLEVVEKANLS